MAPVPESLLGSFPDEPEHTDSLVRTIRVLARVDAP